MSHEFYTLGIDIGSTTVKMVAAGELKREGAGKATRYIRLQ